MSDALSSKGHETWNVLISQIEYYEAILERTGLVKREGEFRNHKLGMTLDLLRPMDIPENLKSELSSAIIGAWRLMAPEKNLEAREDELNLALRGLEAVRSAVNWTWAHPGPVGEVRLYAAIMSSLPLMSSDLNSDDVPKVRDLLSQVMDYLAAKMDIAIVSGSGNYSANHG